MGRLRRDRRMVGLFPSNFVQVLDDSFRPASRTVSPMPDRLPSPNPFNPPPSEERKTKPFRKPFQAYAAPDFALQKRGNIQKKENLSEPRASSPSSVAYNNSILRAPSPSLQNMPRVPSPQPTCDFGSHLQSPEPSFSYRPHSRQPSLDSYREEFGSSSPPPAPPPHRHTYKAEFPKDSKWHSDGASSTPHSSTPCPPSPGPTGLTPSPLRNAMEDVISSLEDMGMSREIQSPVPGLDPWSPEAFDQTYICPSKYGRPQRPNTSMGILGQDQGHDDNAGIPYDSFSNSRYPDDQQPPELSNYVERMESRLRRMRQSSPRPMNDGSGYFDMNGMRPLIQPLKAVSHHGGMEPSVPHVTPSDPKLQRRKSAFDVGRQMLGRTFTTKSNATSSSSAQSTATNGSSSTQATEHSLMSGHSAGGLSSTSAGSLARKNEALQNRALSAMAVHRKEYSGFHGDIDINRPETPLTGVTFYSSHASQLPKAQSQDGWDGSVQDSGRLLGGLVAPKLKKSGFFKKFIESAKTGAASARSSIVSSEAARAPTASRNVLPDGITAIAGGLSSVHIGNANREMGLGGPCVDWLQVRRDVNRSNSLSRIERVERRERCQMMDYPAISPIEELYQTTEGNEGANGIPVAQPMNFQTVNLSLVDKNSRFINSLPPMTNPTSLATGYVCRPYRSDVQRLRAIFTWVSEKISWEEDFIGDVDCKRIIQTKRGCAEEVAVLVKEMCAAVGIHAEVVRGYLKSPGEIPELGLVPQSNHWWNAVLVDDEWRIMDCSLASPTNPRRSLYSSTGPQIAETWWFLTKPMEICWTHIPEHHQQQHIFPPVAHDILLALPCACPPFFKNSIEMVDYDTSILRIEDLELVQLKLVVPADVECVAMLEARAFQLDTDGDLFESGGVVKKHVLSQAEWVGGHKHFTIKALLPGDEGHGILKIYAGKRGLMHSIKDVPHPLALALPVIHTGENPPYEFVVRYPTPHAQRHDLYIAQPQCQRLTVNNTFVFAIRQHPSSPASSPNPGSTSPVPSVRPSSSMSVTAPSVSGSNPSSNNAYSIKKPAKLAIQAPGGKILRLMRKDERSMGIGQSCLAGDGGTWETIIKCGEKGVWRGLVLADRSARWCVFAEWICV